MRVNGLVCSRIHLLEINYYFIILIIHIFIFFYFRFRVPTHKLRERDTNLIITIKALQNTKIIEYSNKNFSRFLSLAAIKNRTKSVLVIIVIIIDVIYIRVNHTKNKNN